MPLTLTESQKKAHDSERHLSVTANAGSGKTMVLVHRYVDILLKANVNVSDVVAITFTEKAASELKKKIADSIEERISQAKDPLQQQRFESIREGLASAFFLCPSVAGLSRGSGGRCQLRRT
jgi:ATP-dependent exoDNAse (exonuclease V) beta subunit